MTLDDRTEQARVTGVRRSVRPETPANKRQARKPKRSKSTKPKSTRRAERAERAKKAEHVQKAAHGGRAGPVRSEARRCREDAAAVAPEGPAASAPGSGRGPAPVWALGERSAQRYATQARESARTSPLATVVSPVTPALDGAPEEDGERATTAKSGPDGPPAAELPGPEPAPVNEAGHEGRRDDEAEAGDSQAVGTVGGPPVADPAALAFDFLHTSHAGALARQAYLLTGNREVAQWAVARAFHTAWERWPEVARDPDPAGWVRAVAHEYALSPWLRFWPGRSGPEEYAGPPEHRLFLETFWALPRTYRRTLLLHDGLGLDLAETAAETEASTPATVGRLRHAREALAAAVDAHGTEGADFGGDGIGGEGHGGLVPRVRTHLAEAAAAHEVRSEAPRAVRAISETASRRLTLSACGLTAVLVGMTAFTIATTESGSLLPTGVPAAVAELAR